MNVDASDAGLQEDFKVIEKTLTLLEARSQNSKPFTRKVIQTGIGQKAKVLLETETSLGQFPEMEPAKDYRVGAGDTISFAKLTESPNISNYEAKH